ncbi:BA75_00739T0 [Komagataella pastoris]|uniref:BA75_00739T0 n=1 Tax=Komagataella pastoris TaxID=4922 RepID=A0A1B2J5D4_PICPA|nr:BA75_00739T0 [Komagataella pastoris]
MTESIVASAPKAFGVTKFRVKNRSSLGVPICDSSIGESKKYSCVKCRKLKKKCSREFPECATCTMSGTYCRYTERKKRRTQSLESSSVEASSPSPATFKPQEPNYVLSSTVKNLSNISEPEEKATSPYPTRIHLPPIDTLKFSSSLDVLQCKLLSNSFNITSNGSSYSIIPVHLTTKYFEAFHNFQEQAGTFITCDDIKSSQANSHYTLANDKNLVCKFNLVVAIGATFLSHSQHNMLSFEEHKLGTSARENALELISKENLISKDTLPITEILILITLYTCLERDPSLSWNLIGMTTRNSLLMNLNRNSGDSEYSQRLFWSCYNLDRLISFSLIQPVALEDAYINIPMMEHEQFIRITSLRVLEGKVLKKVHGLSKSDSSELVTELRGLVDRYDEVITEYSKDQVASNNSKLWFLAEYYNLVLLLYYPSQLDSTPSKFQLETLASVCSKFLPCIYNLQATKVLLYNWISFYRVLSLLSAHLYCVDHGAAQLSDSSIAQYSSLLQGYVKTWPFTVDFIQIVESLPRRLPNEALTSYKQLLKQHSIRISNIL